MFFTIKTVHNSGTWIKLTSEYWSINARKQLSHHVFGNRFGVINGIDMSPVIQTQGGGSAWDLGGIQVNNINSIYPSVRYNVRNTNYTFTHGLYFGHHLDTDPLQYSSEQNNLSIL